MKIPAAFRYWSRWVTARKLACVRKRDPDWISSLERIAAIGGTNLQLD